MEVGEKKLGLRSQGAKGQDLLFTGHAGTEWQGQGRPNLCPSEGNLLVEGVLEMWSSQSSRVYGISLRLNIIRSIAFPRPADL